MFRQAILLPIAAICAALVLGGCYQQKATPAKEASFYKHTLSALAPLAPVQPEDDWRRLEIPLQMWNPADGEWPPPNATDGFYLIRAARNLQSAPVATSSVRYAALSDGRLVSGASSRWPAAASEVLAGIGAEQTAWMARFLAPNVTYEQTSRYLRLNNDTANLQRVVRHQLRREKALLPNAKPSNTNLEADAPYAALGQAERDLGLARAAEARGAEKEARKQILSAAARIEMAHALQLDSPTTEVRAVWLRLDSPDERNIRRIIKNIATAGITDVFLDTIYDGRAIFPTTSLLTPQHTKFVGTDPLADFLVEAQREQIRVHAGIRLLSLGEPSDTPIPRKHPEWIAMDRDGQPFNRMERGRVFLTPFSPEVQQHLRDQVTQIADNYGVVGIQFDDIRYGRAPGFAAGFDYSNAARKAFFEETKRDPMKMQPNDSQWNEWLQFRADTLTGLMRNVSEAVRERKPELLLSVRVGLDSRNQSEAGALEDAQEWPLWVEADLVDIIVFHTPERNIDHLAYTFRTAAQRLPAGRPWLAGLSPYVERQTYPLLDQISRVRLFNPSGIALMGYNDLRERHFELLGSGPFRSSAIAGSRNLTPPSNLRR